MSGRVDGNVHRCPKCGSQDVFAKAYINLNDVKLYYVYGESMAECHGCGEVGVVREFRAEETNE